MFEASLSFFDIMGYPSLCIMHPTRHPWVFLSPWGLIHKLNNHVWGCFHRYFHTGGHEPMRRSLGFSTIWFRVGTFLGASAQRVMLDSTGLEGCGENGARHQFKLSFLHKY